MGLLFKKGNTFNLEGWTDASWADNVDTGRSTSGYLFIIGGTAVSWASRKQETVALFSTEAEYMGQSAATQEVIWLRGLISEITNKELEPTTLFADNRGAVALAVNPTFHRRTKHIAIRYHFIREKVEDDTIKLVWLSTNDMVADGLTKGLPKAKF